MRADLDRARIQVAERAAEAVVHFDEIGVLRAQLEVVRERLTAANCAVTALTLEGLAMKGESDANKEREAVCTSFFFSSLCRMTEFWFNLMLFNYLLLTR